MAVEAAVQTLVIVIVGSGLQELLTRLNESEISPGEYDAACLAKLFQQFASKMIELPLARPVPNTNGNSSSAGSYTAYKLAAVALAALAILCLLSKGSYFSRIMYVTRHYFKNAVETLCKQIEDVQASLTSTKAFLSEKLGGLDLKMDQLKELSNKTLDYLTDVKSTLSYIGNKLEQIYNTLSEMNERVKCVEIKQNMCNKGISFLCNHVKAGHHKSELLNNSSKGLQVLLRTA